MTLVEAWGISLDKISFYSDALLQSHSLLHSLALSASGNTRFHVPAVGTAGRCSLVCAAVSRWCSTRDQLCSSQSPLWTGRVQHTSLSQKKKQWSWLCSLTGFRVFRIRIWAAPGRLILFQSRSHFHCSSWCPWHILTMGLERVGSSASLLVLHRGDSLQLLQSSSVAPAIWQLKVLFLIFFFGLWLEIVLW